MPTLEKFPRGASLWVPVTAPGQWYLEEAKHTLQNASIPVAFTRGENTPSISDFSRPPGIFDVSCKAGAFADSSPISDLSENALRSLLVMVRLTAAYTNEIASCCMIEDRACRSALWELEKRGYVEYHGNDTYIDSHLSSSRQRSSKGEKKKQTLGPVGEYGVPDCLLLCGPGEFLPALYLVIVQREIAY